MSYASDNSAQEMCDKGTEHGKGVNDFQRMLECFGYSEDSWMDASTSEKAQVRWNWKHIQKRGTE